MQGQILTTGSALGSRVKTTGSNWGSWGSKPRGQRDHKSEGLTITTGSSYGSSYGSASPDFSDRAGEDLNHGVSAGGVQFTGVSFPKREND